MSWHKGPLAAFDLESTGPKPTDDLIVTGTVWRYSPGAQASDTTLLVNLGVPIPEQATKIHGITTEQAQREGIPAGEAVRVLAALLADHIADGAPIVIYNAPFDLTMLDRECRRHGVPTLFELCARDQLTPYFIDPLVLDRLIDPRRTGSRKLAAVCAHYGVDLSDEDAHTSNGDCLAAARLAYRMASRFPKLAAMPLPELQARQTAAYREQAHQFAARVQGMGIVRDVPTEWPYVPVRPVQESLI
ncbi:exonuclease domain-containing protein [Amycolatopsis carbonis]|uniref:Exonuclease domain-containing protein n=1 Tax=Amycolatopsis carbonis TaxID=715471 RepID=A0A9Y2MRX7_9PSEU|nr:exonuclease domain-containing protein [Amycolatopsis sp. 2-15]WIX75986.1 exonuclease domain-containing protein [Amycolatopsis sp. 2-15]